MKNYNKSKNIFCLALFFLIQINPLFSFAEDLQDPKEDPNKGLPKAGLLSSTYQTGAESRSVDVWSKSGSAVDALPPISGSVSKISERQWKAKVFNNTTDTFNADVRVKQLNAKGDTIKTDSFSLKIKAGTSSERIVAGLANATNAQLELVSWKRIAKPKVEEESSNSKLEQTLDPKLGANEEAQNDGED